jgi:3-oxoacyl-[acyl-carrier protein] reductase
MTKLEGKVALVTGAGRGIGRAIALKLAREGARVVVNDLDDEPAAETIAEIAAEGGAAVSCSGSVVAPGFAERFVQTALERFGGLDIIGPFRILRAAAEPIRRFAKQEAEEGREVFRKVVNISSVSGLCGNAGQINYAAGKAAVVGMTKTLAKEWGRYRVNVNCVAFGFISTRMTKPLGDERLDSLAKQQIPLGRLGTVEEAANGVYLFCTPESDYISGQVITVGGGIRF